MSQTYLKINSKAIGIVICLMMVCALSNIWTTPISSELPQIIPSENTPLTASSTAFYISPTNGNDSNDGSITSPWATIAHAQAHIRTLNTAMSEDIMVYLFGGTYRMNETLSFTSSDSGTNNHKIIYRNYGNEIPVLDAGEVLTGWELHKGKIWRVRPKVDDFRQLYVRTTTGNYHNTPEPNINNVSQEPYAGSPTGLSVMSPTYDGSSNWERRAIRAKQAVPEKTFDINGDGHIVLVSNGIFSHIDQWPTPFAGIDLNVPQTYGADQRYIRQIECVYHLMWNLPRVHAESYGDYYNQKLLRMQQPAFSYAQTKGGTMLGHEGSGTVQPSWMENAYIFLDEPGEWYFDPVSGYLFYWPLDNEPLPNNSSAIEFTVPVIETILNISGTPTNPVSNLEFSGLVFKHGSWLRPNEYGKGHVDVQANILVTSNSTEKISERSPAHIIAEYARNISYTRCTFTKMGGAALDMVTGIQDSIVQGCRFDDISGTAINVGSTNGSMTESDPEVVRNISISNNYFRNIAVEFKGGHAIFGGYIQFVTISHNLIVGTAYSPIGVGWGWSGKLTVCHDNAIEYNHIVNYLMEMKDGAAIYTLSLQNRTRVQFNHIHDGSGSGLYPDEQTWMTTWKYNVVYRSGNSLQDHTLGVELNNTSIRQNEISENYFDMMPIIEPKRQQTHIATNIWNITNTPSSEVLAIVATAGIESLYSDIAPSMLIFRMKTHAGLYWSDAESDDSVTLNLTYLTIAFIFMVMGLTGLAYINKSNKNVKLK